MTEDERLDLIDRLPADMNIWADHEEAADHFSDRGLNWWMNALGHEKAHRGCCKACGCATTCIAAAFGEALIASVVRELDKIGALKSGH